MTPRREEERAGLTSQADDSDRMAGEIEEAGPLLALVDEVRRLREDGLQEDSHRTASPA